MTVVVSDVMLERAKRKRYQAHIVEMFYSLHYAKMQFDDAIKNLKEMTDFKVSLNNRQSLSEFSSDEALVTDSGELYFHGIFFSLPFSLINSDGYVQVEEFDFFKSIFDRLLPSYEYEFLDSIYKAKSEREILETFEFCSFDSYVMAFNFVENILVEFGGFLRIYNSLKYLSQGFNVYGESGDLSWMIVDSTVESEELPF